jgi:signal peptidase II
MRRTSFFALAGCVVILDQLTKYWDVTSLSMYSNVQLIPGFLYFTRTVNSGAAFGILPHATYVLALTAFIAAVGIIAYAMRSSWPLPLWTGFGLALPLGGACGNFIDRVRLGHVVDFIEVLFGSYTFPIFNVADSSICIGVAILVMFALKSPSRTDASENKTRSLQ